MNVMRYAAPAMLVALSACVGTPSERPPEELRPEVRALAAPGQNLDQVRLESDGCYWYRYEGPVETTFLPLLTREDRMICVRTPTT
ncbi:hypothetical protein HKCCSP123_13725 [Rhodobacterales bacterium HKCCSP123]|nr:hypothetical protein [Rhodobacterales bacterium HKCCSP123]